MNEYRVTFSTEYVVKARSESEAIDKAETKLAEFFEDMPCGPTEIFKRKVELLSTAAGKTIRK